MTHRESGNSSFGFAMRPQFLLMHLRTLPNSPPRMVTTSGANSVARRFAQDLRAGQHACHESSICNQTGCREKRMPTKKMRNASANAKERRNGKRNKHNRAEHVKTQPATQNKPHHHPMRRTCGAHAVLPPPRPKTNGGLKKTRPKTNALKNCTN